MVKKYLTAKGYKKLQKELEECKKARLVIAQAIKAAKEHGDLSENAEYAEAKRKQRDNEARIVELENILRTSRVVPNSTSTETVQIGCVVEVESSGVQNTFSIVGASEADPIKGFISNESPLGAGMLGKKKGEEVNITLPNGRTAVYKILAIKRQA